MSDYLPVTTVIFDGECDFCRSCVEWVNNRYRIEAIPNQNIEPDRYGITREQCEKSVVVIDAKTYFGAEAVALLLKKSGHRILSLLITLLGPIGNWGYKYVAAHRDGKLVAFLHWIIRKTI